MEKEDRSIISALKAGNEEAFKTLFFKYYEPLCQFACRYVHSMAAAEDLVQEVLADVWDTRAELTKEGSFRSYLYTLVKNRALDHVSHLRVVEKYEKEVEFQLYSDIEIDAMLQYESKSEKFIKDVQNAIEQLPQKTQNIYKLSRNDGLTYKEISEVLSISVKTVEKHISKALRLLRENLIQYIPMLAFTLGLGLLGF